MQKDGPEYYKLTLEYLNKETVRLGVLGDPRDIAHGLYTVMSESPELATAIMGACGLWMVKNGFPFDKLQEFAERADKLNR